MGVRELDTPGASWRGRNGCREESRELGRWTAKNLGEM
jgi:hypothetical protein